MEFNQFNEFLAQPNNWKRTHIKEYSAYMCRPSLYTNCVDKRTHMQLQTTQEKQFIVAGVAGEYYICDGNEIAGKFTFDNGEPITPLTITDRCFKNGEMPWTKIKARPSNNNLWAVIVPTEIKHFRVITTWGDIMAANIQENENGYGDVIMCSDMAGRPNIYDTWVVNGDLFPYMYDLHSFKNIYDTAKYSAIENKPKEEFASSIDESPEELVGVGPKDHHRLKALPKSASGQEDITVFAKTLREAANRFNASRGANKVDLDIRIGNARIASGARVRCCRVLSVNPRTGNKTIIAEVAKMEDTELAMLKIVTDDEDRYIDIRDKNTCKRVITAILLVAEAGQE